MKHWLLRSVVIFSIALANVGQVSAEEAKLQEITISDAWAKPSLIGAPTGAVYLLIANTGKENDAIVSLQTPVAENAELHSMEMSGNVMKMRSIESLVIPAGEKVTLEPSHLHIMLIGLKKQLKSGETFPLSITFKQGGKRDIEVKVK